MTRPKTREYVTYSFKCLKGRDDDLIDVLDSVKDDRSAFIRKRVRQSLHLPLPADPQTVDLTALRSELAQAVNDILTGIPNASFGGKQPSSILQGLRDVNDKGARIPDF